MPVQRRNRVKDQTTSTGTGTITVSLISPVGYQTMAAHTSGATVRYLIIGTSEWEVGEGVWTSGVNTLTRATVYTSSNSNNLVNFSVGTKTVITTPTAADLDEMALFTGSYTAGGIAYGNGSAVAITSAGTAGQVLTSNGSSAPTWGSASGAVANGTMYENNLTVTSNYTLTTNKNAMSVGPITIASGVTVTIPSGQRWVVI